MQSQSKPKPLIVIIGPTAVGKTEISLHLAERFKGEIISADSRLFYRGMDIGTAKPTREERDRVPHHLIDVTDPDQVWSLAKYQQAAYTVIDKLHHHGGIPFLVGGTGQYVRAVTEGWDIPEVKPDLRLRDALRNWAAEIGHFELYERLSLVDPLAAEKIDPQNIRRIVRALEVIFTTGQLFSAQRQRSGTPYQTLTLGITRPRSELYERIDARIQGMLEAGFVEEVQSLLDKGFSPDNPPLSAIGYRQVIAYLHGEIPLEAAVVQIKRLTRQYVRQQANWFKPDDPNICWFQVGSSIFGEMEAAIDQFLHR
jgi:tRNA dimethylallyltransferase